MSNCFTSKPCKSYVGRFLYLVSLQISELRCVSWQDNLTSWQNSPTTRKLTCFQCSARTLKISCKWPVSKQFSVSLSSRLKQKDEIVSGTRIRYWPYHKGKKCYRASPRKLSKLCHFTKENLIEFSHFRNLLIRTSLDIVDGFRALLWQAVSFSSFY